MEAPAVQRTYEVLYSGSVPPKTVDSVVDVLRADGIEPETARVEYRSQEPDPLMLAVSVVIAWGGKVTVEGLIKPTADAIGLEVRDALIRASRGLRNRLEAGGRYEVLVSAGDVFFVAYDVPANDQEDRAWDAMRADFEARPTVGGRRHWSPDRGWLTEAERRIG